jgi:L-alanine-DL-glutamate epimerase-like enolase superfamily enzyme
LGRDKHESLKSLRVEAFTVPTDAPESDGTLSWDKTTIVVVEIEAVGHTGLGYIYADLATAHLIQHQLAALIEGCDPMNIPACWAAMRHGIRNLGRPGIVSMAISAVDAALWDLKARRLGLPLARLLGAVREEVPIYGSGGFTSYSDLQLQHQLAGWAEQGIGAVKMKVGRQPERDPERVRAARAAIGEHTALYVDGNGAYARQQALQLAHVFVDEGVNWFEEPVTSDDLAGLHWLRERLPPGMEVAAGEYGYDLVYFWRMLQAGAVDVQQADATRCGGISEFLRVGALCAAAQTPMSAHTAPALHLHACCALERLRNIEYFHDHARIEAMLFDGVVSPRGGVLRPDWSRPGLGLELKRRDARRYAA